MGPISKRDRNHASGSSNASKKGSSGRSRDRFGVFSSGKTEKHHIDGHSSSAPASHNSNMNHSSGNILQPSHHERSSSSSKSEKSHSINHSSRGHRGRVAGRPPKEKDHYKEHSKEKDKSRNSHNNYNTPAVGNSHHAAQDVSSQHSSLPRCQPNQLPSHIPNPSLDPLLLARGMSARFVGARVGHHLKTLNAEQIDKDLRHMDAHRTACITYAQQYFAFRNQELVRSGHFGSYGGLLIPEDVDEDGAARSSNDPAPPLTSSIGSVNPLLPTSSSSSHSQRFSKYPANFALPVKIDPEEDKRLAILRKKIIQSEFTREQLETEYLSLRAHYVHQSQYLQKTRLYEIGRWKLLIDLINRHGKVLALKRVQMAMARDIYHCLKYRTALMDKAGGGMANFLNKKKNAIFKSVSSSDGKDIVKFWKNIEAQLKEAEAACKEAPTPLELQRDANLPDALSSSYDGKNERSRSPNRPNNEEEDGASSEKRSSTSPSASGSKKKLRTGSNSGSSSADESSVAGINASSKHAANNNGSNGGASGNDGKRKQDAAVAISANVMRNVIPWESVVQPPTPFDLPLAVSCLSLHPDKVIGFLIDKNKPDAVTYLESSLPASSAAFDSDADELLKLREEARLLTEELNRETERNAELQTKIIANRKKNDKMVSMMQLLRSETEAVLERHNIILETPEARAKAAELHRKATEEERKTRPAERSTPGEEEEDDHNHDDGELEDHDEHEDDFSQDDDDSAEEGEIQEDDDEENDGDDEGDDEGDEEDAVRIKEVIVNSNNSGHADTDDDEDDEDDRHADDNGDEEEEGEIIEDDDAEEGEIDDRHDMSMNKRGHIEDEEDSHTSPHNSGSFKKRRRG